MWFSPLHAVGNCAEAFEMKETFVLYTLLDMRYNSNGGSMPEQLNSQEQGVVDTIGMQGKVR